MDIDSLSNSQKTVLLARIAHQLTVSARSTYEPGTENILEPKILRGYNELMHRVTSSIRTHAEDGKGMPLEAVLEMMHAFGSHYKKEKEIDWVLKTAQERPF